MAHPSFLLAVININDPLIFKVYILFENIEVKYPSGFKLKNLVFKTKFFMLLNFELIYIVY